MPFGMDPAGWAYALPYAYPYASAPYSMWSWWGWLARRLGSRLGSWARLALVYTLLVPVVVEPQIKSFEGGEICLTDLVEGEVEDSVSEEVWGLASMEALLPGPMWA